MNLLNIALQYAERGWPVFPLLPGLKKPMTDHRLNNATTNAEIIKQWWLRNPSANIGIRTGKESNLVVLDFDIKKGQQGRETFSQLQKHI